MGLESPIPLAPRPRDGELLSSWVGRLACRYALDSQDLIGRLRPPLMPLPLGQMDYRAPLDLLTQLAAVARIPLARLDLLQLAEAYPDVPRYWFSWQWPRFWPSTGTMLYPIAIEPGYCPQCLREDLRSHGHAFLRAEWALACTTICPKHKQPLARHCGHCRRPRPIRHSVLDEGSRLICLKCSRGLDEAPGGDAAEIAQTKLTAAAYPAISALEADIRVALEGGAPSPWWFGETNAATFLAIVECFCSLLTRGRASMGRRPLLGEFLPPSFYVRDKRAEHDDYPFWFAHLGVERRRLLFGAIIEIAAIDTWRHSVLRDPRGRFPFGHDLSWLWPRLFEPERHRLMELIRGGPRDLAARVQIAAETWGTAHAARHHCREEERRLQARLRRVAEIDAARSALRGAFEAGHRITVDTEGRCPIGSAGADEATLALVNRLGHWTRALAVKLAGRSGRDAQAFSDRFQTPGLPLALPGADYYRDMARAILRRQGREAAGLRRSGGDATLRRWMHDAVEASASEDRSGRSRSRHTSPPGQRAIGAGTPRCNG